MQKIIICNKNVNIIIIIEQPNRHSTCIPFIALSISVRAQGAGRPGWVCQALFNILAEKWTKETQSQRIKSPKFYLSFQKSCRWTCRLFAVWVYSVIFSKFGMRARSVWIFINSCCCCCCCWCFRWFFACLFASFFSMLSH